MRTYLATGRGWGLLAFAALVSSMAAPAWAACNGNPNARIDPGTQTVPERTGGVPTVVTLNGAPSTPNNSDVVVAWQYLGSTPAGLTVTLSNPASRTPTFSAPNVGVGGAALRFRLTVTNNPTSSDPSLSGVTVYVVDAGTGQNVANFAKEGAGQESSVVNKGPGSFYLDTNTANADYTVTVEDCVGSPSSGGTPPGGSGGSNPSPVNNSNGVIPDTTSGRW